MEKRFYLIKLLVNDKGQGASSVTEYPDEDASIVAYHQTCAAYRNAQDVRWAYVYVQGMDGNLVTPPETIEHIPAPDTVEE